MDEELKPTEEAEFNKEVIIQEKPSENSDSIEKVRSIKEVEPSEEIKLIEDKEKVKPAKGKRAFVKTILFILLILILLVSAVGATYWWRDKTATEFEKTQSDTISSLQKSKGDLEKQLATEKAKTNPALIPNTEPICTPISPNASTIANIKLSITSGNTQALEGYMASSVNVILAATEAYGPQTPTQAVSDVTTFISDETLGWDFALSASVLGSYGEGSYGQYFPGIAVVGKSANNKVISFSFDCDGKISTVFLASSEDILE